MNCDKSHLPSQLQLYAVTDGPRTDENALRLAVQAGVTCVQLREKNLPFDDFLHKAIAFQNICHEYNIPLLINDNLTIAQRIHAVGVHLGQEDGSIRLARQTLGKTAILGVSVHNVSEALAAYRDGADYLGVGAVFPTSTKQDATLVPLDLVCKITQAVPLPVVAIGGINHENIVLLQKTGICGVALVSAIFGQPNITTAVTSLKKLTAAFSPAEGQV